MIYTCKELQERLKWIVPRLFGFLCSRGLYPLLAVDFAEDVLTDLALEDSKHIIYNRIQYNIT